MLGVYLDAGFCYSTSEIHMVNLFSFYTYIIVVLFFQGMTANSTPTDNAIFLILFTALSITDKDLSYDHLASGLKATLAKDKSAFDADRLQKLTGNLLSLGLFCSG